MPPPPFPLLPTASGGGRPARGRSGLADDFRRGRRRSGDDRAAAALARHPRQDRGGADRDWLRLRTAGAAAVICFAAAGRDHRAWGYDRSRIRDRNPALVSLAGQAQPVPPTPDLVTARDNF